MFWDVARGYPVRGEWGIFARRGVRKKSGYKSKKILMKSGIEHRGEDTSDGRC